MRAALVLGLAVSVVPCPAAARAARLLVLGDSLGAGYGLAQGQSFPARLAADLTAQGHPVEIVDASVSGDTSAGGLARIGDALARHPDAILLELGANDALRGVDPASTFANLDRIVARVEAAHLPILLLGMRAPANWGRHYERRFDAIYPRLAAAYHIELYPFLLEGVALDPKLNQSDLLHPSAAGAALIARRLVPYVRRLLAAGASGH